MKYILILQWPSDSQEDFDALIAMEDVLEGELTDDHGYVDGHDLGSGEMNIFIHTDNPKGAFADATRSLGDYSQWASVRAAYRSTDGESYEILWPANLRTFSVH